MIDIVAQAIRSEYSARILLRTIPLLQKCTRWPEALLLGSLNTRALVEYSSSKLRCRLNVRRRAQLAGWWSSFCSASLKVIVVWDSAAWSRGGLVTCIAPGVG